MVSSVTSSAPIYTSTSNQIGHGQVPPIASVAPVLAHHSQPQHQQQHQQQQQPTPQPVQSMGNPPVVVTTNATPVQQVCRLHRLYSTNYLLYVISPIFGTCFCSAFEITPSPLLFLCAGYSVLPYKSRGS